MGATIDYAIVLMNRYLVLKNEHPKKEAMSIAVNQSFATVLTSGSIMTIAGILIGVRVSDVYVSHIGLAVGRGALTSVILVLTVLPQLLVQFDRAVEKTTFTIKLDGEDAS
jgi:predicted RND superfamily exporter protein